MLPEVARLLTSHTGNTSNSEDILTSACYTVRNLMASQPQMAKRFFSSSMINNVVNLCRSRWAGSRVLAPVPSAAPSPAEHRSPRGVGGSPGTEAQHNLDLCVRQQPARGPQGTLSPQRA